MTEHEKREKVIKGLECCLHRGETLIGKCPQCPYFDRKIVCSREKDLKRDAIALLKAMSAFKVYFDGLYGQGLEVANWHQNGAMEPLDNFIDSAMEGFEDA